MENRKKTLLIRGFKFFHFVVTICLFFLIWTAYLRGNHISIAPRYHLFVSALYGLLTYFFVRTYNGYLIEYSRGLHIYFSLFLTAVISITAIYVVTLVAWEKFFPPYYFLLLLLCQLAFNAFWVIVVMKTYYAINQPVKTLLVYRNKSDLARLDEVKRFPKKYKVEKMLENPATYEAVVEAVGDCQTIFLAGVDANIRNGVVKYCAEKGIQGFFLPHVGDIIMMNSEHVQAFHMPIVSLHNANTHPEYLLVKRLFDILISAVAIAVLSPLMAVVAIAIKCQDGGPALYKQVRLTKDGKKFKIYKFRSMRVDAEKDGVARLSTGENDDRITPVGKVIRACRLDELPQLFNIFKGDMTIVGPRPERPEIAAQYEETMPAFRLRLQVKAGLTGYAQVYGKYNTDPYDKLEMDLIYINKMNLFMDIQLMFATVRILFMKDSTEGIESGSTTAMK